MRIVLKWEWPMNIKIHIGNFQIKMKALKREITW